MADVPLHDLTLAEVSSLIRARRLSPLEYTQALLTRTDALEPQLNAYITRTSDAALEDARSAEAEIDLAARTSTSHRRYLLPPVCVTSTHATNERPPKIAEQQRREHRSTVRSLSERAVSAAQNCGSAGYSTPMRAAAMPAMSSLRSLHSLWVARVKLARGDPGVELAGSARGLVRDRRR